MRLLDAGISMTRIENVGCMQESGAFHADVDECRLHPGQYPRDAAFINVADQSAPAGALQKYFLQNAIFHDRGASLVGAGVNENIRAHRRQHVTPAASSSAAVSNSGNPITPE